MNAQIFLKEILPQTVKFRLARRNFMKPGNPVTLTYSVTAACQSLCKTCQIGKLYRHNPARAKDDLSIEEIGKIFQSLGHVFFFNISGGEPFLRKDLPGIVEMACRYLTPGIIHIPTNALAPERIQQQTREILKVIDSYSPGTPLTIKPSIDGVGVRHDEIRGVRGNFEKLIKTVEYLKEIEREHPNFHLELGTVISNFNIDHLAEIEDYVHSLGVQSYRNEIAEQRTEFFNLDDPITPDADTYERLIKEFKGKIIQNIANKRKLARMTESLRLVYYDLVVQILREKRQIIPCYGGISNVHINYNGEVWPCCVLGYDQPMGFLREANYDFKSVWHSDQAGAVRKYIRNGNCACPLANQAYSNILCSINHLFKAATNVIRFT